MKQPPDPRTRVTSPAPAFYILLSFGLALLLLVDLGCHKASPTPPPPAPPTPPVQKPDTIAVVKKDTLWELVTLEEIDSSRGPSPVHTNRLFHFYYDSSMRVTTVGISDHNGVSIDTTTCWIFYNGGAIQPSMIITPILSGPPAGPATYDTTWFSYGYGRLLSDSSTDHSSYLHPNTRQILTRHYTYPNNTTTLVSWYGEPAADGTPQFIRSDSATAPGDPSQFIRTQFYRPVNLQLTPTYAVAEAFKFTPLINPLSKMTVGGNVFSLIYDPVKRELLGNSFTKAILNSNIIPDYLDFYSPNIPSSFYISGYISGSDWLIAAMGDRFDLRVVADSALPQLPKLISVGATTAIDGRFVYKYTYWSKIK